MLFVANANTNDLAVVNVKEPGASTPLGFIPTGWYPTSVRVARDGKTIYVANGKGATSKANRDGPNPLARGRRTTTREYIAGLFQGTLSTIPMPDAQADGRLLADGLRVQPARDRTTRPPSPARSPRRATRSRRKVGDPSPIKHCVYIIKENRTYDQVFGDMPEGNGEPSLCLFPEDVTPNHHALVREFVLLDNFYVDGEVSADGHEWTMGAYATDYVETDLAARLPRRTAGCPIRPKGRWSIARPAGGYLWDRAAEKGVSYRSYGEFIKNGTDRRRPRARPRSRPSKGHFDPKFRSFDLDYPDVKRADRFLEELAGFEKTGEMPRLVDPPPAQRPHLGDLARQADADGLRRRQRPGAGPGGRGPEQEPVLAAHGDLRRRGRRPERLGPRRCPPDGRPGDQPVHQAALGRLDDVQHLVDAPDDRAAASASTR